MRPGVLSICLIASVALEFAALATPLQDDTCGWFHEALGAVPHQALSFESGAHKSVYDGRTYTGCEIRFKTNSTLLAGREVPNLDAVEGTRLYELGWQMDNSIAADGPGSSLFAVRRGQRLCVIRESQPAHLEGSGHIVQSPLLQITVQCRQE